MTQFFSNHSDVVSSLNAITAKMDNTSQVLNLNIFRKKCKLREPVGLILGTGWKEAIKKMEILARFPLKSLPGFTNLGHLEGHDREILFGFLDERPVIVLSGRIHLNEGLHNPDSHRMLRLMSELLPALGAKTIVITNAAGSLNDTLIPVGSVVEITDCLTLVAPDLPLLMGEFCSHMSVLLQSDVVKAACDAAGLVHARGTYAMVRGPNFEGPTDKQVLAHMNADCVGMSTLPELAILAARADKLKEPIHVVALSCISNTMTEKHSHDANIAQLKKNSGKLATLLTELVENL